MECKSTAVLLKLFTKLDVMCAKMSLLEPVKNLTVAVVRTVVAVAIVSVLHKSKVPRYENTINGMLVAVKLFRYCYRLVANTAILLYPNRRHLESRCSQAVWFYKMTLCQISALPGPSKCCQCTLLDI